MVEIKKISVEDYLMLRASAGFKKMSDRQAETGLKNSIVFVAEEDKRPIGMARIITDGGYFYLVVDVIVLPEFQGKGIGKEILTHLMEYIKGKVSKEERCFVSLTAADGKNGFYKRFGFNDANGMMQYIEK